MKPQKWNPNYLTVLSRNLMMLISLSKNCFEFISLFLPISHSSSYSCLSLGCIKIHAVLSFYKATVYKLGQRHCK
jgi:hypothetical protein